MSEYLDASIIVKWFKREEDYSEEALKLRNRVINFDTEFVMSYYGLLETVRALVKSNFPEEEIEDCFQNLHDLYDIGALKNVNVDEVLFLAKDVEIELNLYASDALHVASAINHGCNIIWSVDDHHLKNKTKDFLKKYDVESKHLSEIDI